MCSKFFLEVNTDIAALADVLSWFEQLNQPPINEAEIWWQCQTLLIEGFTNAVEHAHRSLSAQTPIYIEAYRDEKLIEIRIFSQGEPFNLQQKLEELPEFEDNHQERGRGLKIMSLLADKLSYEKISPNLYCLSISKFYSQ